MTTVDEARVEAALGEWFESEKWHVGMFPKYATRWRERMARALAAADAVRGDQQGAPSGPGWSAEPEPVPASAEGGEYPPHSWPAVPHKMSDIEERLSALRGAQEAGIVAGDEFIFGTLAEFVLEVLAQHHKSLNHIMPDRSHDI